MSTFLVGLVCLGLGFIAGALVYRKNSAQIEAEYAKIQALRGKL